MPGPLVVVLAGGASSRMGADKALAELAGAPMLARVLAAVGAAGFDAVVAGPARDVAAVRFLPDPPGTAGPAAGLAAGFLAAPDRDLLLVATDQPFLRPATLGHLAALPGEAVVPLDGARQTMCAVFRPPCAPVLQALLAERPNPSLQTLLDRVATTVVEPATWASWGEDGRSWLSIDTPERLRDAAAGWPEPPQRR